VYWSYPRRTTRVVNAADHQFPLKPGSQLFIGIAELSERPFDHVDRVRPPEEGRVGLSDLECNLRTLTRIAGEAQGLLQVFEGSLSPCGRLRPGGLPQDLNPQMIWGRFSQRPAQEVCRGARRPRPHSQSRRVKQTGQDPVISSWPHHEQMRCDLAGGRSIGVQETGCGAMQGVARIAFQGALDRGANDGMNEPRRVVRGQHLETSKACGNRDRIAHFDAGDRRRMTQLTSVPEHGERLREGQCPWA
jgi:hypothetical protein